jgi:hypothetical protein
MEKFNVGSDTKITILVNGVPLGAQRMTKFEAKQEATEVKSTRISGQTSARNLPMGWTLDLEWDRGNSVLDDFFVSEEANRFAGQPPADVSIMETTTNPDNSISRYRYDGVTLKQDTKGERSGDTKVTQKASGFASRQRAA